MAVDFYNLNINSDNDIIEFSRKYQYSNIPMPNIESTFGEMQTLVMIQEGGQNLYDKEKGYELREHEVLLHDNKDDGFVETILTP